MAAWPPDKPWSDCEAWSEALFGLPFEKVLNLIEALDPEGAQELRRAMAG